MSNITIFSDASTGVSTYKRETKLADKINVGSALNRIQLNTNGTFKRLVNGEQVGKAVKGAIDVVIVDMLSDVSRAYYAGKYDPSAPPSLPDCWSNLGKAPEPSAPRKQATSCGDCRMNVKGSGEMGGRACRFQRRLAVLLVGDASGDLYQINIPAKSLFGKGTGNVHPFESYKKYLVAAGEAPDTVVTRIMYNDEADTMEVQFQPVRHLSPQEGALVDAAQASGEAEKYVALTVGAAQGAKAPAPALVAAAPVSANASAAMFADDDEDEEEAPPAEPVKRASKKAAAAPVEDKPALSSVMNKWLDDDGDDADDTPF